MVNIFFKLILVVTLLCLTGPIHACKLAPSSPFFWKDETLIKRTSLILWLKLIKIEPFKDESLGYQKHFEYTFEVLDVMKGKHSGKYFISRDFVAPPKISKHNPHLSSEFQGRTLFAPDCKLYEYGEINKKYLLFVDAFHPKYFEEVGSTNDKWFKKVNQLIGTP